MFKRRKYSISFFKAAQNMDWGGYEEVTDGFILRVLSDMQENYEFEIVSIKIRDIFSESKIIIRCNKDDKTKIFMDFCIKLSRDINKVTISR